MNREHPSKAVSIFTVILFVSGCGSRSAPTVSTPDIATLTMSVGPTASKIVDGPP